MISMVRSMALAILFLPCVYGAADGAISGTIKDPTGTPFQGAFIRVRNEQRKITMSVLSDKQGHYRVPNLQPGEYDLKATAIGYKSDPRIGVKVSASGAASLDFALQKVAVTWSDLTVDQGRKLLPEGKGKEMLFAQCVSCHGFQSRMAGTHLSKQGWVQAVSYMRQVMRYILTPLVSDQDAADISAYLYTVFGADSKLPASPAELPGYAETVQSFSDEAMKIVYVDYDLPGPNRFPWNAAPGKDGKMWVPDYGKANRVARLDPATGEIQEFVTPYKGTAGIHSAVPGPDGTVWFSEQGPNRLGKLIPATKEIAEFQGSYLPGKEGISPGGQKHTIRVDSKGLVWSSGVPLTRFDPRTGKFTEFPDVPSAYGIALDANDNVWYAEFRPNGVLGRVDGKTGKVTKWSPPTPDARPRRLQVDSDGIVWFAEFRAGKIGRFDPRTESFKEYALPGPDPTPYGFEIDSQHKLWYSSLNTDVFGCLDPKTGQVTEYPFPYRENATREIFRDAQGRMWFSSPPNNKVGYFKLADGN